MHVESRAMEEDQYRLSRCQVDGSLSICRRGCVLVADGKHLQDGS